MAGRIRTIKPELIEDSVAARLSNHEFRLFVGLILMADDYGNLRADPDQLHASIFWGQRLDPDDTARAIATLHARGLVDLFDQREQPYAHITGWDKHQRVDKPGKPRCAKPNDDGCVARIRESVARLSHRISDLRPPNPTSESDPDPEGTSEREGESGESAASASPPASASPGPAFALQPTSDKPKRQRRAKPSVIPEAVRPACERLWALQERLRAASIPGSRPLVASDERMARVAERLKSHSEADCEHVLAVYASRARYEPGQAVWFDGTNNWGAKGFDMAMGRVPLSGSASSGGKQGGGMSPEQITAFADFAAQKGIANGED